MTVLATRLDFALPLIEHENVTHKVGEILSSPCFAALDRVSARRKDRWTKHAKPAPNVIAEYLLDSSYDAISMDNRDGEEVLGSAEIESGVRNRDGVPATTRFFAYVVLPVEAGGWREALQGVLDLATALDTGAGMIAEEPSYAFGQRFALGGSKPKPRPGLSELRMYERRARDWKRELVSEKLAGVEWGTFLGADHLKVMNAEALRRTNVFERVLELAPNLVFLQLTADPADDLSGGFEAKRIEARRALGPLMMEIGDVSVD